MSDSRSVPPEKTATPQTTPPSAQNGVLTDARDGKKYKVVKIGSQTWMAENLNYETRGSKCYDNNSGNCVKYGRLYNWHTAMDACPSGWHLPSKSEYEALDKAVGGEKVAGKKLKAKSLNLDSLDLRINLIGGEDVEKSGKSFNRENQVF